MSENALMPAASDREVFWRNPALDAPPRGCKLLLLTTGGVAVIGLWSDDGGFVAWSPLPKRVTRPADE